MLIHKPTIFIFYISTRSDIQREVGISGGFVRVAINIFTILIGVCEFLRSRAGAGPLCQNNLHHLLLSNQ